MAEVRNKIELRIQDCGVAGYGEILQRQEELVIKRREGSIPNTVLIVEHNAVITLGARESANMMLVSEEELRGRGIELVRIRRGGGATAHNPGQVLVYPILDLRSMGLGVSEYVRELEGIGIELLGQFGVKAERKKGFPGLWVSEKKISSIGVRVSRGITHHGIAININNNLSIFNLIVPCGLTGVEMTSVLAETGVESNIAEVKRRLGELCRRRWSGEAAE